MEIRPLTPDDDLTAQLYLGERAFGMMSPAAREGWLRRNEDPVADGRFFAVFDGGRQVGGAAWHDMRQWWAGREVPMAGVAAVKIAPEVRGQGLGRQLMIEVLREIAARGYPLSALYPATMPIYRALGWELAGGRYHAVVPARALRSIAPPDKAIAGGSGQGIPGGYPRESGAPPRASTVPDDMLRPAMPALRPAARGDAAEVIAVIGRAHQAARDLGPVTRDLASVQSWFNASPGAYRYLCDDGFISYQWQPGNGGLFADWMVAASPGAQRALLALLAGHSSTADTVELRTSPDSPLWWLLRERDAKLVKRSMWMLRVIDLQAAITSRGFASGITGAVRMTVVDGALSPNGGTWELTVFGGAGAVEKVGADPEALTVGARGLAALYAGTPVQTLRLAGLATGGSPSDDALLTGAFAGTAYMLDDF